MRQLLVLFAALLLHALPASAGKVNVVEIHGAITPASAGLFLRALDHAQREGASLVVLKLDTPGGLDTSMREMIQAILASRVPVATWVAPSGARAASAGTYLLYASHIAAMAPGTNLGAATPVAIGIGGEKPEPKKPAGGKEDAPAPGAMEKKAVQDAAAYIRSLAQLRGRDAKWAEQAVREAASLSADEARQRKVIDFIAADLADLLRQAEGRRIKVAAGEQKLALTNAVVTTVAPSWKERLLMAIANPNIALILMMLGVYGLLFEFYSPGFGVAGITGAICLLLALYALAMLPISATGALLIVLGLVLMGMEAIVPSFGAFGIGGIVAFVAGSLMLIDADVPGLEVSLAFIVPLAVLSALVVAGVGTFALRSRRRPTVSGVESMIGSRAVAIEDFATEGWVEAFGERWKARSDAPMQRGAQGRITAVEGLTLIIDSTGKGEST